MAHASAAVDASSGARTGDRKAVTWWENVSFAATHAVLSATLFCLSLRGLYRLGRLFGTLEWLINYKRRRRFAAAFERVVGHKPAPAERRRATREYFRRSRCDKLFYLIFDRIPRDKSMSLFSIHNASLLDTAVRRGRGVYLAMSHHGSYHIVGMLLALYGYKTTAVRDRQEGGLRRWVQSRFDRLYPEFGRMRVLFSDSYPRDIYRCFRDEYVVGSAMDVSRLRRPNQKAEDVTIFGEKRPFLSGPLRVALRCGAPVVQAFIVPEKYFRYRLDIVMMLIDPETVDNEDAAVTTAMADYAANVETHLRATPSLITRI
jgi:lauroyl/myristoyl acyltransferase